MSRELEQSDDRSAASDEVLDTDDLVAFIERAESLGRLNLEEKYGPDVRLLAEDDDKLFLYLQSEDLSLKRVALLCLLRVDTVYPDRIVRQTADYIVNGDDIEIRSLCIRFLGKSPNDEITSILRDCASKLGTRDARPGDDVVRKSVVSCVEQVVSRRRAYAETEIAAERILARLKSASERNDSNDQSTHSHAGESDRDI